MSFDPFAAGSDLPPEYNPAAPPSAEPSYAQQRVKAPAIALIVVGVMNLLGSGWIFFNVAMMAMTSADRLHEQMLDIYQSFPEMKAELNKKSPAELKNQSMFLGWGMVAVAVVGAVLCIVGGVRMLALKNYALVICGAIFAALPCLSAMSCCGVGEIIGIWALIVLLNTDVRAAFQ